MKMKFPTFPTDNTDMLRFPDGTTVATLKSRAKKLKAAGEFPTLGQAQDALASAAMERGRAVSFSEAIEAIKYWYEKWNKQPLAVVARQIEDPEISYLFRFGRTEILDFSDPEGFYYEVLGLDKIKERHVELGWDRLDPDDVEAIVAEEERAWVENFGYVVAFPGYPGRADISPVPYAPTFQEAVEWYLDDPTVFEILSGWEAALSIVNLYDPVSEVTKNLMREARIFGLDTGWSEREFHVECMLQAERAQAEEMRDELFGEYCVRVSRESWGYWDTMFVVSADPREDKGVYKWLLKELSGVVDRWSSREIINCVNFQDFTVHVFDSEKNRVRTLEGHFHWKRDEEEEPEWVEEEAGLSESDRLDEYVRDNLDELLSMEFEDAS